MRTRNRTTGRNRARAPRMLPRKPLLGAAGAVVLASVSPVVFAPGAHGQTQSTIPVVAEPAQVVQSPNSATIAINPIAAVPQVSVPVAGTAPVPAKATTATTTTTTTKVAKSTKTTKAPKPESGAAPAVAPASVTPVVAVNGSGPTPEGGVATEAPTKAPKYSDPLADLAATALDSLRLRPAGPVQAATATATDTAVPTAGAPQTQVTGGTPISGPQPGPAGGPGGQSWTSVTINTDELANYVFGTAIAIPQDPQTISIISTLPAEPQGRYQSALKAVAASVASRIKGAKADEIEKVWLRTDDRRMTVILTALAQVGTMYRWTGNKPGGFDCSGLTSYSWLKAGVKIPRVSQEQINAAKAKARADLLPGDLVWRPGHIGLYLGVDDYMVHSPQTGKPVEVRHWGRILRFGSPL